MCDWWLELNIFEVLKTKSCMQKVALPQSPCFCFLFCRVHFPRTDVTLQTVPKKKLLHVMISCPIQAETKVLYNVYKNRFLPDLLLVSSAFSLFFVRSFSFVPFALPFHVHHFFFFYSLCLCSPFIFTMFLFFVALPCLLDFCLSTFFRRLTRPPAVPKRDFSMIFSCTIHTIH